MDVDVVTRVVVEHAGERFGELIAVHDGGVDHHRVSVERTHRELAHRQLLGQHAQVGRRRARLAV